MCPDPLFDLRLSESALFEAVLKDDWLNVEAMLNGGASPSARDAYNKTPLHAAMLAEDNRVEYPKNNTARILDLLLAAGADINASDVSGWTPLHDAVANGFNYGVEVLIRRGADIMALDRAGLSPYGLACSIKDEGLVRLFENKISMDRQAKARDQTERCARLQKNLDFIDRIAVRRKKT